jgi:hypothetical protein
VAPNSAYFQRSANMAKSCPALVKRINLNVDNDIHSLLKSICALKGVTLSEWVYNLLLREFEYLFKNDEQLRQMFLSGEYVAGSKAALLKAKIKNE